MKDAREILITDERRAGKHEETAGARSRLFKRRALLSATLMLALMCFFLINISADSRPSLSAKESVATPFASQDYSKFSHQSSKHASLQCTACHERRDNSARPTFPGHKACTSCHLSQFTTPAVPMCSICHTDVGSAQPPLRGFPENFKESFNVKFDHAQHMRGDAKPERGCAACHDKPLRRGAAISIPAGLSAHNQCYACHTPGKESGWRNISSCGICHARARYSPTSTNGSAFRASFSHAEHGPRQRLDCAACHNLIAGTAQSRQVTSPLTAQHFASARGQSCMACHNGKRSFGAELEFNDCKRCHKGPTFKM
ncbi:MAG: cytochrome c3 family protein [Pyrinomonadaceae bacterium]